MPIRQRLRTIIVCFVLELGALSGIPMRPNEIEDLMRTLNQPKVAHTIPDESKKGDGL